VASRPEELAEVLQKIKSEMGEVGA
jgi:hypothetical protein